MEVDGEGSLGRAAPSGQCRNWNQGKGKKPQGNEITEKKIPAKKMSNLRLKSNPEE